MEAVLHDDTVKRQAEAGYVALLYSLVRSWTAAEDLAQEARIAATSLRALCAVDPATGHVLRGRCLRPGRSWRGQPPEHARAWSIISSTAAGDVGWIHPRRGRSRAVAAAVTAGWLRVSHSVWMTDSCAVCQTPAEPQSGFQNDHQRTPT